MSNKFKRFFEIALEDNFKGIEYKLIHSNDPIISLCGGACTFNNSDYVIKNVEGFLENTEDVIKAGSNNPTLIDECKQIKDTPAITPIVILHNDLLKTLSSDEQKAILYHELGHIYHDHNKKNMEGTAGSFIEMELEADEYAINELGPKVLHSALEKCLDFGAKFAIIAMKESATPFIKKLLTNNIINKFMIGHIYKMNKKAHVQRFKTLKHLEKQM